MLREIENARQIEGEPPRRWFFSHEQDLLVWLGPDGVPTAFQLAYDKYTAEHAVRWKAGRGFSHYVVDDGESSVGKEAPLLYPDGAFDVAKVVNHFIELSASMPRDIVDFVVERLREHPEYRDGL